MLLRTPGDYHSVISRHKQGLWDSCWEAKHQRTGLILLPSELLGQRVTQPQATGAAARVGLSPSPQHHSNGMVQARRAVLLTGYKCQQAFFCCFLFFFNGLQRTRSCFFFYSLETSKISPLLLITLADCNQDQNRKVLINRLRMLSSATEWAVRAFRQG